MENNKLNNTSIIMDIKLNKNDYSNVVDFILYKSLAINLMLLRAIGLDIIYTLSLISILILTKMIISKII